VPVSYRVSISGFAQDEREELAQCFGRRSLIAYQSIDDAASSDIAIVDADLPQTFHTHVAAREASRILYVGHSMPSDARWHVPRPVEPGLVLRMLDELVAQERPAPHAFVDYYSDLIVAAPRAPILDDATRRRLAGLGEAPTSTAAATALRAPGHAPVTEPGVFAIDSGIDDDALDSALMPFDALGSELAPLLSPNEAKAAWQAPVDRRRAKRSQRAAVRRAQRAQASTSGAYVSGAMIEGAVHALVLDSHSTSRVETGVLLNTFGFETQTVASVAEAERALWSKPFAVAFVGEPADGPQASVGLELCHRIKQGAYGSPYAKPKIVMVASRPRPVDSVRARLAGCDHFVEGPTSRGLVAQALDAVSIAMPRDPRED
jgi:CheY-like chemotaxis protein